MPICDHLCCIYIIIVGTSYFSLNLLWIDLLTEWDEKEEGKEIAQQWEDDWDDDDVNDDFSLQLRRELENNSEKSQVYAPLFFLLLRLILLFVRQSLDGIMLYCFSAIVENSWWNQITFSGTQGYCI